MGSYITVSADVDVWLEEISDEDILEEFMERKLVLPDDYVHVIEKSDIHLLLDSIYHLRRCGKDYQQQLDELIYGVIGRI